MATAQQYRRAYKMLIGKYKKKMEDSGGKITAMPRVTQSTLVLIQAIDPQKSNYIFPVLDSDPIVSTEEIRLNINDEFFILEKGLYIVAAISSDDDPVVQGRMWFTSAPLEFCGNAGWMELQNLYRGGTFSIKVNNVVYVENWDTKKHEYTGITQMKSASAGMPYATSRSVDFAKAGMFDMEPNVTLSGAKKNEIQLSLEHPMVLPAAKTWTVGDATGDGVIGIAPIQIAVVYRGLLAQNAAKFQ